MSSSSSHDLFEGLPAPKRIKTASTSLPSSSSSSSASPPNLKWTYDVFLSFRGEDTRNNFVDHLFMNLTQKGINTFRDDEKLERGKEISGDLLKAIEESRFAIIIFSENYASSSWCLDELVKIIDCTKETGQIAYPVFYNVNPSNVRKQEGSFAKAFDEHLEKNLALGKMKKWKKALSHAGRLSGWDTRNRPEAKIIQEIVEGIFYKLSRTLLHDVDDNLVGLEFHMKEINTLLSTRSDDVKFIGIHGLGGIGKTTIAKVIYNKISYQFQGCSYLANVREKYEKKGNLVSLQEQLLYEILKVQDFKIFDDDNGSSVIRNRLNNQKVLVILDDVDHVNQLEKLARNGEWFGRGSRIIITTRDQHLLNKYEGVQRYEVKESDRGKSLQIFSWKAFKQNYPPEDYKELSNEVVHYAQGLPLALTVLGSHLCGRSKDAWRGAIEELKIVPNEDVTKILKISYNGLNPIQKNVFLDIACFFNGKDKDGVMEKLDSFGFFPSINIQVLIDKSLITVSAKNKLMMHDLVRDMGRYIVREEFPENPGKRSRLWNAEDIRRVLEKDMATEAIEGIQSNFYMSSCSFKAEAFMEMKNLRFLEWESYPCEHLALDFPHDKLVHLSLTCSSIESLCNGRQALLPRLKSIDLSFSGDLREFPDVTGLPNLERLSLVECEELVEIHPSVWVHKRLKFLDLDDCRNLVGSFPNKIEMESLETLSLRESSIKSLWNGRQALLPHLKFIDLFYSKHLREFPDVTGLPKLERLCLNRCRELVEIHPSVWVHKRLKILNLDQCYNLGSFPNKIEMESLETLSLRESSIKSLWNGRQADLPRLKSINLSHSSCLREFPDVTGLPKLERLSLRECYNLVEIHPSVWVHKGLKFLDLGYCGKLESFPNKIEMESLETLDLQWCMKMEEFPEVHGNMKHLKILGLASCKNLGLLSICKLKYLEKLDLRGCSALEQLNLSGCSALEKLALWGCSAFEQLNLSGCSALEQLDLSVRLALEQLNLSGCSALEQLDLSVCLALEQLNLSGCSALKQLDLTSCSILKKLPENIGDLESLVMLDASRTAIKEVPTSIQFLDKLKFLSFRCCRGLKLPSFYSLPSSLTDLDLSSCNLETFPSNIECLSSLETLNLNHNNFESLPTNITQLSLLTRLDLIGCERLKSVPELPSRIRIRTSGCATISLNLDLL